MSTKSLFYCGLILVLILEQCGYAFLFFHNVYVSNMLHIFNNYNHCILIGKMY